MQRGVLYKHVAGSSKQQSNIYASVIYFFVFHIDTRRATAVHSIIKKNIGKG